MSDLSVIGLGDMGSAIARALLAAGLAVTVWNRSDARVTPLVERGATAAVSAGAAIEASPAALLCVSDYPATMALFEGTTRALHGRLIVQFASGTPAQARALETKVRQAGGRYLDGAIGAWPRQVGSPDASFTLAGNADDFAAARPLLDLLGGQLTHVGPDAGHAKAYANAGLAYFAGHWIGFAQGAALLETEGLDPAMLGDMLASMGPILATDMQRMGRAIATEAFDEAESTVKTIAGDLRWLAELADATGAEAEFARLAAALFARARDLGLGDKQHSAIIKVLRGRLAAPVPPA
ncbi:hypothetical protein ASC89_05190 [Devosia sp. Root413D1]|uniref:NAD(P)-dependent oxidoreductase n=1 Tax=Devosia sp. Root413D1 TaxID=1736531 RepID=UPI0006FA97B8|nr:NAD(P)-binding domain-containing protein [Devosia sp. Root413D1]KQW81225.1 hypothetical protein ASC89_05190 [Devosia sp. Root413D1]